MTTLEIKGRRVQVGEGFLKLSPEQQQSTVNEIAQSMMPDERSIDKRTGARPGVRAAVGSLSKPEDRLKQIQKYYPDAQPYGDDNFVFTHPETKRPTLYNDQSWMPSLGDVASVIPEMYEVAGGIGGGALALPPAVAGAPVTGGASSLLVPIGIGLGAAAGRELGVNTVQYFTGAEDTRNIPERLTDATLTAGVNAAGSKAGDLLVAGGKKVFGPIRSALGRRGQSVMQDFSATGVRPTAGAVTGNRGMQIVEKGVSNTPGGAAVMQDVAREQSDQFARGIGNLTDNLGGAGTQQSTGGAIRESTSNAVGRFGQRQEQLYGNAFAAIGPDRAVNLPATRQLIYNLTAQRNAAAGARDDVLDPVINRVRNITQAGGQITFDAIRRLRTDVGKMLKAPLQGRTESAQTDALNALYGALTRDIQTAADAAGPHARRLLDVADRYTRFNLTVNSKLWDKVAKLDADEKVYEYITGEASKGGTLLRKLRHNFSGEEWDTLAATVIDRLGEATPGAKGAATLGGEAADFSINRFMTNWEKISPEAKASLFGGSRYAQLRQSLDSFAEVGKRLKDVERMSNPSGTARNLLTGAAIGTAGLALVQGDPKSAAGIVIGAVVAPRVTARLITSPAFVRWLTATASVGTRNPNSLASMTGRLTAIAKAEPELRGELIGLQAALAQAITPQREKR